MRVIRFTDEDKDNVSAGNLSVTVASHESVNDTKQNTKQEQTLFASFPTSHVDLLPNERRAAAVELIPQHVQRGSVLRK